MIITKDISRDIAYPYSLGYRIQALEWLSENISPPQVSEVGYRPIKSGSNKRKLHSRRLDFCRVKNHFVNDIGFNIDSNNIFRMKGKGWRFYAAAYVHIEERIDSTVHMIRQGVFIKIFDDMKALQFKLAVG